MKAQKRAKICLIISASIMVIALILSLCGLGINLGIDFSGGLSMQYKLTAENAGTLKDDVESTLKDMNVGTFAATFQGAENNEVNIRIKDVKLDSTEADLAETAEVPAEVAEETAEVVAETAEAASETAEVAAETAEAAAETAEVAAETAEAAAETAEVAAETAAETVLVNTDAAAETVEVPAEAVAEAAKESGALNTGINRIQKKFEAALAEKGITAELIGDVSYVGPVAGATLVRNAVISVLIASVLMLIYIAIRFDLSSGLAAVFGLLHDVLMMLAFMVLLRSVIQMNSSFIAAMLTIVGYSINNTIVIFDRIRENHRKSPSTACAEIAETSVKECLGRTINTTATTLITIIALCILGVASIREFALPIIIGILSGVYSANLINGYVWAFLEEKRNAGKTKKA